MRFDRSRLVIIAGIILLIVVLGLVVISQQPTILKQETATNYGSKQALPVAKATATSAPRTSQLAPSAQSSQMANGIAARPTTTPVPIATIGPPDAENLPLYLYPGARDVKY